MAAKSLTNMSDSELTALRHDLMQERVALRQRIKLVTGEIDRRVEGAEVERRLGGMSGDARRKVMQHLTGVGGIESGEKFDG